MKGRGGVTGPAPGKENDMSIIERIGDTIFSTPSGRELVAERSVEAPPWLVWEAWTRPEHPPNWMLGPGGWTMPVCEIDLRPGGRWHFVWRQPDGAEMEMSGEYREVVPGHRIVNTESWGGEWPETVNTLELCELGGVTTITCTVQYPSSEARDRAISTGMLGGWAASYDKLDRYLETLERR
jgi:uncharacterized protein YndB with AHSA1/START domain